MHGVRNQAGTMERSSSYGAKGLAREGGSLSENQKYRVKKGTDLLKKETDLFVGIFSGPALFPVFNATPNDPFNFI